MLKTLHRSEGSRSPSRRAFFSEKKGTTSHLPLQMQPGLKLSSLQKQDGLQVRGMFLLELHLQVSLRQKKGKDPWRPLCPRLGAWDKATRTAASQAGRSYLGGETGRGEPGTRSVYLSRVPQRRRRHRNFWTERSGDSRPTGSHSARTLHGSVPDPQNRPGAHRPSSCAS